jgi:hypothetical protein
MRNCHTYKIILIDKIQESELSKLFRNGEFNHKTYSKVDTILNFAGVKTPVLNVEAILEGKYYLFLQAGLNENSYPLQIAR